MTGAQVLTLLITISVLLATSIGWKDWLSAKEREHGQEITTQLSKQETERLKLVTEALTKMPELHHNKEAIMNFQSNLSNKLKPTDQIKVDGESIINGERAAQIVSPPKESSKEIRLDGKYAINQVKFPHKYGGEYRFSVTRLSDDSTFMVDVAPDILTDDQIAILKDSAFGIKHVIMSINAKENRGQITNAKMVSIEWPK